jgi:hypothetical protein
MGHEPNPVGTVQPQGGLVRRAGKSVATGCGPPAGVVPPVGVRRGESGGGASVGAYLK